MKRGSRGRKRHVLLVDVRQQNQKKRLHGHMVSMLVGITLLAVVGVGVHIAVKGFFMTAFFKNQDFALKEIDVEVSGNVPKAEVVEWAGVMPGMNLMSLNIDSIRNRLEAMPAISKARVERELPSTLRIVVEERQPVAKIMPYSPAGNQLAQSVYYIDGNGYIMKPKAGERLKPLPVITGVSIEAIQEGARTDRPELMSALNLLRLADFSTLKEELDLTQIEVQSKGYLVLRTRDRGMIRFRTDYLNQQIQRLQVILRYAEDKNMFVRTVDLTPEQNVPVTFFN